MGRQTRQLRRTRNLRSKPSALEEPSLPTLSGRLAQWLQQLNGLPVDAPEWEEMPAFAAHMIDIHAENLAERTIALEQALEDSTKAITKLYSNELRYMEMDISPWPADAADRPWAVPQAHNLVLELQAALQSYSEVRPQASTQRQEQQRAPLRAEREQVVIATHERWDELMRQPSGLPLGMLSPNGVDENPAVSTAEYAALQEKAHKWEQKYQKAQSALDKRTVERDQARAQVEHLRALASKPERAPTQTVSPDNIAAAPREGTIEIEQMNVSSVAEAIAAASATFPDTLTMALNSASDENTPFKRPNDVYRALVWLATEYHELRTNPPGTDPEFERRLKEACPGWFYSPKQSDTAKNMFKAEYETTLDSRTYTLDQHLGKGIKGDPQYMIRIAFDWDDDSEKVIVGYIGRHQRTQSS